MLLNLVHAIVLQELPFLQPLILVQFQSLQHHLEVLILEQPPVQEVCVLQIHLFFLEANQIESQLENSLILDVLKVEKLFEGLYVLENLIQIEGEFVFGLVIVGEEALLEVLLRDDFSDIENFDLLVSRAVFCIVLGDFLESNIQFLVEI